MDNKEGLIDGYRSGQKEPFEVNNKTIEDNINKVIYNKGYIQGLIMDNNTSIMIDIKGILGY